MGYKLLLLAILATLVYSCKDASAKEIEIITAAEMQTHMKYDNLQVVDLQPEEDYKKSHLLNAHNIIYNKDFRHNLENLDKKKPVAIYCTSGKVSPEAAKILKEAGFEHIYVLDGGISKWKEEIDKVESVQ
ncbi:rhodanese-like domain-containing protein [Antarcticibacterium flavum]|uniref:Rhodanese-like domain-containing protein n=1 Tax=Antarcticibacterium flavum TaxID=2058175 RepID=A0A5B7X4Z9_9FLAO|nr:MULTISPECIES: rhodanese-like domain-containing protein [Antarcticibacterium]MCM4159978.1 rhodanese-like domain-containing protein [Antarcticibacterium sp. W02-3]QCY70429.1 rhodanese-like domain-containing protein [Antarcticibacterium flavum]